MNPQKTMQQYGKSYYLATQFFPSEVRYDVYLIYYLVRIPDLVVDQPWLDNTETYDKLVALLDERKRAYYDSEDNQFRQVAELFLRKNIDSQLVVDFRDAMLMDTRVKMYETYEQLQVYMYGSAEVVGLMMCQLFAVDERAYPHARALWEAMQLTNFLRDIREDYVDLWRVYLPSDVLKKYGLIHQDVIESLSQTDWKISDSLKSVLQELWERCEKQYAFAHEWLHYLPDYARRAVHIASELYQWIWKKVVKYNYDSINNDCHTTKWDKLRIVGSYVIQRFLWRVLKKERR